MMDYDALKEEVSRYGNYMVVQDHIIIKGMKIRGGQKKQKLDFELAPYLIPFSLLHWFQKHKDHLWEVLPPERHFPPKYTKDFKIYEGKIFSVEFSILLL